MPKAETKEMKKTIPAKSALRLKLLDMLKSGNFKPETNKSEEKGTERGK